MRPTFTSSPHGQMVDSRVTRLGVTLGSATSRGSDTSVRKSEFDKAGGI